jgi:hypothetical protein
MRTVDDRGRHNVRPAARKGARAAALWGLAARGVLYLVLAALAVDLVVGPPDSKVDTTGALHSLATSTLGRVLLWALAVGFAAFAVWHVYEAVRGERDREAVQRLLDLGRAAVYAVLCALAAGFALNSQSQRDSEHTERTWTARVLDWPGGRALVAGAGLVIAATGVYLVWRASTNRTQDEPAVRDAAPNEPRWLRTLGSVGNVARGAVVVLVGAFLVGAAIAHDPSDSVGLDGALKRVLDHSIGSLAVLFVAVGFAAFGVYCVARAWLNRRQLPTA